MQVVVSSFYKFVPIAEPHVLVGCLKTQAGAHGLKGTILVAPEGLNGTVSGPPAAVRAFHALLRADPRFADLASKDAVAAAHPFLRLKVRLKREIITLRRPEADPLRHAGRYVRPEDWNSLIQSPDVVLLDTRNGYEVAAGTFQGAIDPGIAHFTEWPEAVARTLEHARGRRIAMFCTGGIRCEKASAYLRAHGFRDVYQLEGGILAYLARVPREESLWRGKCFVFDARGAVDEATEFIGSGADDTSSPDTAASGPAGEAP